MTLKDIRKRIDAIDDRILQLLQARMEQVLMASRHKKEVEDARREQEIFDRIRAGVTSLVEAEFGEKIFELIIGESKRLQNEGRRLMAFQGEHGAYGEEASRAWDSEMVPFPCATFEEVFERVQAGLCDMGIVPVENTWGGSVERVNRLLIHTDLCVAGAAALCIRHCLLALPDTDHREIRSVYSHPQALSQCRRFLARNHLDPVAYPDTAGAGRMLSETRPKRSAVIASRLCADIYGLEIIKENIQDMEKNITRFLVLSRKPAQEGDKCSIVFATEHKAGTLFNVLQVFADKAINLTRIESIPNEPGDYAFFLDFEGSDRDPSVEKALAQVQKMTTRFRLMGCYTERRIP
ncbi:MAG: bifunctional chorismate mutase/prephenate dehydratase [Desulfococcus sp. 4484_242]|nr:MAG: bifunctional chorismate mutase/prephenate dehydratase [Desulfococcus sp. 4484_242]